MATIRCAGARRGIFFILLCLLLCPSEGRCGITLDGTMGTQGVLSGPNFTISAGMGKQVGGNLFQSFSTFNIDTGERATFTGPSSVSNIISRVTGGDSSTINGTIESAIMGADLFFINPAGVMIGPHAKLDVSGSFHVSTADYIVLGEGGRFDARDPSQSVLTTAPPSAFGFLGNNPGGISVNDGLLEVPAGKILSLVGGNITIQNGTLYAPDGTINIVSAASQGEAVFSGSKMSADSFGKLGTVTIKDARYDSERPLNDIGDMVGNIDVSGDGGGSIYIRGGQFVVDRGYLFADSYGGNDGGGIDISMTGNSTLTDFSLITANVFGAGRGGDITMETGSLSLTGCALIDSSTYSISGGDAGDITVKANGSVVIDGHYDDGLTLWSSLILSDTHGTGNAGNVSIEAGTLSITDAAQISSSARSDSEGSAGNITIKAQEMSVSGYYDNGSYLYPSFVLSDTYSKGNAGNISIEAGTLSITDAAQISSSARSDSEGSAGNIIITANDILLAGYYDSGANFYSSSIKSATYGKGNAGNITIDADSLSVIDAGQISTTSWGSDEGNGGNIEIKANEVSLSGYYDDGSFVYQSSIESDTYSKGNAGNISIDTGTLSITDAGQISSSAHLGSEGNGGNIGIKANEVSLSGYYDDGFLVHQSSILSETHSKGDAGNITIDTGSLSIADAGQISTTSWGSDEGNGGNIGIKANKVSLSGYYDDGFLVHQSSILSDTYGKGNAGNIMIDTGSLSIADAGQISSSAHLGSEGNGGNIEIKANEVSLSGYYDDGFLVHQSSILSETYGKGNAGNIMIDTGSLSIADAGQISSSAYSDSEGNGGNIEIKANEVSLSGYYDNGFLVHQSSILSETHGKGDAGNITMDTGSLSVDDAGQISTTSWGSGEGNGGDIEIKADDVSLSGYYDDGVLFYQSSIVSETYGGGNAGNIMIDTGSLSVADAGQISTTAWSGSEGNGGSITIKAGDRITISGHYDSGQGVYPAWIKSETFGAGSAGDISIETGSLFISDDGQISTSAREGSGGSGGDITIKADDAVSIVGYYDSGQAVYGSSIASETFGKGDAGNITVDTGSLLIADAGGISSSAREGSEGNGGNIHINANEVSLSGYYDSGAGVYPTWITSETFGMGDAGGISIDTGSLSVANAAQISSSTRPGSEGNGGSITIRASDMIAISGYYDSGRGVYSSSVFGDTLGKGDAGDITIDTGSLSLADAGQISTTARAGSEGNGGNIRIKASEVSLSGYYDSGDNFFVSVIKSETFGAGDAGDIAIDAGSLSVADAGQISSSTRTGSEGSGGSITIRAGDMVTISGHYDNGAGVYPAWIKSETFGAGDAGDISIETGSLFIADDGQVSTSAREGSGGSGGDITIKAGDTVSIMGYYDNGKSFYASSIVSETSGRGDAGNISIETADLLLTDAGRISTTAWSGSEGDGGDISVKASDAVFLSGSSGIFSETYDQGRGGHITVQTGNLELTDQSSISVASTFTGTAGDIFIASGDRLILKDSSITAETENADGGNIQLQANMLHLQNSDITSSVKGGTGNGGNITITPVYTVLDKSKIIANAYGGNGGNIMIGADVYLASPDSTVSASSQLGINGSVDISAPWIDMSAKLAVLPSAYLDANVLFPKQCATGEEDASSFVVKGRDGIPPQPDSPLPSP